MTSSRLPLSGVAPVMLEAVRRASSSPSLAAFQKKALTSMNVYLMNGLYSQSEYEVQCRRIRSPPEWFLEQCLEIDEYNLRDQGGGALD